jgi:hypothetical protein
LRSSNSFVEVISIIKPYRYLIKTIFAVGFGYWFYAQINTYLDQINGQSTDVLGQIHYHYICFVVALVPFNWYLEALKWRRLCRPYTDISMLTSIQAVVSGVTLGLVTPARIGDYGGRMLLTPIANKAHIVAATFTGSIAQNLCNIGLGLVLSLPLMDKILDTKLISHNIFYCLILLQVALLTFIFIRIPAILQLVLRWIQRSRFSAYAQRFNTIAAYNKADLWYVLSISLCRYFLYFAQYSFTMHAFDKSIDLLSLMGAVSAIYLIQSVLPLPTFINLFARGELAILVWSLFMVSPIIALCATFSLWVSNLILPAIVGVYFLIQNDYWSIQKQ